MMNNSEGHSNSIELFTLLRQTVDKQSYTQSFIKILPVQVKLGDLIDISDDNFFVCIRIVCEIPLIRSVKFNVNLESTNESPLQM